MKECRICGLSKELHVFNENRLSKDGRGRMCSSCRNIKLEQKARENGLRVVFDVKVDWKEYVFTTLEQEKDLLFAIKRRDGDITWKYIKSYQAYIHWLARRYNHVFDKDRQAYADVVNELNDYLNDKLFKLSRYPDRRQLNKKTGEPGLRPYILTCLKFHVKQLVHAYIDKKYYSNKRHFRRDRTSPLTEEELHIIHTSDISSYTLARRFGKDYHYINFLRRMADPEKKAEQRRKELIWWKNKRNRLKKIRDEKRGYEIPRGLTLEERKIRQSQKRKAAYAASKNYKVKVYKSKFG